MVIRIECPNLRCRTAMTVGEEKFGRSGRCRRCGQRMTLDDRGQASLSDVGGGGSLSDGGSGFSDGATARFARLGRFEVRSRLGTGAFAEVYRAYDPVLDREVALKVPHPGALGSSRAVERF